MCNLFWRINPHRLLNMAGETRGAGEFYLLFYYHVWCLHVLVCLIPGCLYMPSKSVLDQYDIYVST